ncbi:MAG TPA: dihydropteroate synthase [Candidatus Acidoferrales bacterium]|nr:dihydropteroate synthase [Candidatus Acidoferrales bacterium]
MIAPRRIFSLKLPSRTLLLGKRTLLMGVLNVTPDSFSDGAQFLDPRKAVAHALALQKNGADILDIGAESTRPGSHGISAAEELRRLLPVLEALQGRLKVPISIDTRKSSVAEIAIGAGAEILNDVSGLAHDPRLAQVAARHNVPLILMHMRGTPATMQTLPFARNALKDVAAGLRRSVAIARKAGLAKSQLIVDPGIGFGKSFAQNYELLAKLPELARLGFPLLIGTSRKGFLGRTLAKQGGAPAPPSQRLWATAATVAASILAGAHIVRVHDVAEMAQVARVADQIRAASR